MLSVEEAYYSLLVIKGYSPLDFKADSLLTSKACSRCVLTFVLTVWRDALIVVIPLNVFISSISCILTSQVKFWLL